MRDETQVTGNEVKPLEVPSLMGCEEIVFPMLVREWNTEMGPFYKTLLERHFNNTLRLAELNSTAMGGVCAGYEFRPHRIVEDAILFNAELPANAVSQFAPMADDTTYGVIFEDSPHPLAYGYIRRCRILTERALGQLYPGLSGSVPTHEIPAGEYLKRKPVLPDGLHVNDPEAYLSKFYAGAVHCVLCDWGDPARYDIGFGFWKEAEGIYRLWSRVVYTPQ